MSDASWERAQGRDIDTRGSIAKCSQWEAKPAPEKRALQARWRRWQRMRRSSPGLDPIPGLQPAPHVLQRARQDSCPRSAAPPAAATPALPGCLFRVEVRPCRTADRKAGIKQPSLAACCSVASGPQMLVGDCNCCKGVIGSSKHPSGESCRGRQQLMHHCRHELSKK